MYPVSQDWKDTIYSDSLKSKINIYINGVLTDVKILKLKLEHILFTEDESISLGSTPSQALELQLYRKDLPEKINTIKIEYGISIENALKVKDVDKLNVENMDKVKVNNLLKTFGNFETIPMGIFNVEDVDETDSRTITIKAKDNMIKFENEYDGSLLTYPIKLIDLLKDICKKANVELGTSTFLNENNEISVYDNTVKAREYVSYIAEKAGGYAVIGRDGKLYIKNFYESSEEISQSLFKKYTWGEKHVISNVVYQDGIRTWNFGDKTENTLWINPNNMFIIDGEDINRIYEKIKDLTAYSFESETVRMNPALDVGDMLIVNGKPIIYQFSMELKGRFLGEISSKLADKTREDTTVKAVGEKTKRRRIESRIDQDEAKLERIASETTDMSEKVTKVIESLDEISQSMTNIYDFKKQASGRSSIQLDDALKTNILRLELLVEGINSPDTRLSIHTFAQGTGDEYDIVIPMALEEYEGVSDRIVIETNKDTGKSELKVKKYIDKKQLKSEYKVVTDDEERDYTFVLGSDEYYESNNKKQPSSYAMCKLEFYVPYDGSTLELDCINYAESQYDFGILSKIDKELPEDSYEDITSAYKSFKGESSENVQKVTYTDIPAGNHFIYIKYKKDASQDYNNDSLKFRVSQIGSEKEKEYIYTILSEPIVTIINNDYPFELYEGENEIGLYVYRTKNPLSWYMEADYLTNSELNKYFASRVELVSQIKQTLQEISSEILEYIDDEAFGTKIVQNKDSVIYAWNQSNGQTIKLELDEEKNTTFNIYDKEANLLMALKFNGMNFFKQFNNLLGRMGIKKIGSKDFITFDVPISPNSQLENGMAWGMTPTDGSEFIPVMYISDFNYIPNSDASGGVLHLPNISLEMGRTLQFGSVYITNMDPVRQNVAFITHDGKNIMTLTPDNDLSYRNIQILEEIGMYVNQANDELFYVGSPDKPNNDSCWMTSGGYMHAHTLYVEDSTRAGNLSATDVSCTGYVSGHIIDTSSEESKTDITKYENSGIEEVLKTDIYSFLYKDFKSQKKTIGAVIGEKYNCSDEIISEDGKHISLYSMLGVAYKAIQEQQKEIEALKSKVKNLEDEMNRSKKI